MTNKLVLLFVVAIAFTLCFTKMRMKHSAETKESLKLLNHMKNTLCDALQQSAYAMDENVQRLLKNRDVSVVAVSGTKTLAYSVNKGEVIGMCISGNNMDSMFYVLLHELAHIMTVSQHHTEEFWENFKFLVHFAILQGLYVEHNSTSSYCGHQIK
jgi:hypothetical protein